MGCMMSAAAPEEMMCAAPQAMMCAAASAQPSRPARFRPSGSSLESLIKLQAVEGMWASSTSTNLLQSFFFDRMASDAGVRVKVSDAVKAFSANVDDAYTTILALYVLEEYFGHRQAEWAMVAKKAKAYLKSVGIAKPNNLLSAFSSVTLINDTSSQA